MGRKELIPFKVNNVAATQGMAALCYDKMQPGIIQSALCEPVICSLIVPQVDFLRGADGYAFLSAHEGLMVMRPIGAFIACEGRKAVTSIYRKHSWRIFTVLALFV